jgi:hypothetical protein
VTVDNLLTGRKLIQFKLYVSNSNVYPAFDCLREMRFCCFIPFQLNLHSTVEDSVAVKTQTVFLSDEKHRVI